MEEDCGRFGEGTGFRHSTHYGSVSRWREGPSPKSIEADLSVEVEPQTSPSWRATVRIEISLLGLVSADMTFPLCSACQAHCHLLVVQKRCIILSCRASVHAGALVSAVSDSHELPPQLAAPALTEIADGHVSGDCAASRPKTHPP